MQLTTKSVFLSMYKLNLLDTMPLWVTLLLLLAIILLSVRTGVGFARRRSKKQQEDEAPINTLVGASLALFAFILAFTFGMATICFDARKAYLLEEVTTIETTRLRTDLIAEPHSSQIKALLVDYVDLRVSYQNKMDQANQFIEASNTIQTKIWQHIDQIAAEAPRNDAMNALFIDAVNDMFDNQTKRITVGLSYRIPLMIWLTLLVLSMFSMFAVGYLFGKSEKPNWTIVVALCLGFAAVILVIIDLDSARGTIQLNQQPMLDMFERISPK